ncbi:MAG: iron-containing alcohol dehydrogenase [Bacteroidetes bacterium]|nr:iron-containing alcohol dehydrogenase [Bacteroidota bacterium]MBL6943371.1 iron-containing alcohol dehydrogenase [Bacteroidales bacterium]
MENFVAYNPVKLHFGANVINTLGATVKNYGNRVLLTYGKGSVKTYGYYNQVIDQLEKTGLEVFEYSGIKPNPVIEDVEKATLLGRENNIDVIVALGGGSVIDSSKVIALSIATGENGWDFMTWKLQPQKAIPIITVLTIAATGTEMNAAAVVQNHLTGEKIGYVNELMFPKHSFLDPAFTLTVPRNITAYGIVDLIAHAMEAFFGEGEPSVTDQITIEIIKDAIFWGPQLLDDLTNVDLRAIIMLDATLALNGLTNYGKKSGDWGVHSLGHELSLLFDTPHGASLSIVYPAWLKLQKDRIPERIIKLGKGLFGVNNVDDTIKKVEEFFRKLGSPVCMSEIDVNIERKTDIINQYSKNKVSGMHHTLTNRDHKMLVDFMFS